MDKVKVVKIGGNVLDNPSALSEFLPAFAQLTGPKILVHGGGKIASEMSRKLGIEPNMVNGRRITDTATLDVVVMVYAGLINKQLVAGLQAQGCQAMGFCGADANLILAHKRQHPTLDYGWVGDVDEVSLGALLPLLEAGFTPVVAPITHDGNGQLLNTNADTIAAQMAIALAREIPTQLLYCFEKTGVLTHLDQPDSLIPRLSWDDYQQLKAQKIVFEGMLPKLDNCFLALQGGVTSVKMGLFQNLFATRSAPCTELLR